MNKHNSGYWFTCIGFHSSPANRFVPVRDASSTTVVVVTADDNDSKTFKILEITEIT